jgi:hypothetical protein
VDVALGEEAAADGFAGAAFEEDVVGDDDGGATVDLEQGFRASVGSERRERR